MNEQAQKEMELFKQMLIENLTKWPPEISTKIIATISTEMHSHFVAKSEEHRKCAVVIENLFK